MYCRARSSSGVPTGRDPIVAASICTRARAFSTENRGAWRVQAQRQSRTTNDTHRMVPTGYQAPPSRCALPRTGSAEGHVAAERLEAVVVVAGADVAAHPAAGAA